MLQTKENTLSFYCGICSEYNKRSETFWVDLSSTDDCYTPLSTNFCMAVHAKEDDPFR